MQHASLPRPGLRVSVHGPRIDRLSLLVNASIKSECSHHPVSVEHSLRCGLTTIRIAGPAACGKSYLARKLQEKLNQEGFVVEIHEGDAIYPARPRYINQVPPVVEKHTDVNVTIVCVQV